MRWGLIARSEVDRGLGIQTFAMYENLKPDKTLVVLVRSGYEAHPENYPDAEVVKLRNEHGHWKLDEAKVRDWWKDLDVVVSVETLYDWRLVEWAKADGVKTVVHGNPEFWQATNPQPDTWWWPTEWRTDYLPAGPIVPVPVGDNIPITAGDPLDSRPLRVTHVAGSGAMEDRNGTLVVRQAVRRLSSQIKFKIYSQADNPVEDRWEMYQRHHILVLPRRYGGLCLPALEAMASGLMLIMTNCSPNTRWPAMIIESQLSKVVHMQTGPVQVHDMMPNALISKLRHIDAHRNIVAEHQERSRAWADQNRWSVLRETYYDQIDIARRQ